MKFEFLLQNLQLKDNIMTIAPPPPFPLMKRKKQSPFVAIIFFQLMAESTQGHWKF